MKRKILIGVGIGIAVMLGVFIRQMDFPSWKKLDMERLTGLSQTTIVYDAQGQKVAGLHNGENRTIVSVDEIPLHVKNAFIAIEDARFYRHCGIDVRRIGGALLNNIRSGSYEEGASTITQQLIKLTHLTSEKKLSRKVQEAWLALQLERRASKDEILGMYLNVVYFGRGAYGIEAASQSYFGKSCSQLTLSEGAMLAGIIKAPGRYAPHISMERCLARRNLVLEAMVREEMISREMADEAMQENPQIIAQTTSGGGWYVDEVLREAGSVLGCSDEELLGGGYRIYTALSEKMQSAAEQLYREGKYFPPDAQDGIRPESAMIALNPSNGEIYCLIGGRSYETRRGLNRATQMKRQPGSAFKPISVYAAAVDFLGYTPVSMIEDRVRDFGGGYSPSNASGKEYGYVTLRQALLQSMNPAAVDLITRTGIEAAQTYARRAGIELNEQDANLSLALGSLSEGVSPAQLGAAYAALANGGRAVSPHVIRRIEDLYGRVLYEYEEEERHVMQAQSAYMITNMLRDAVQSGTAKRLRILSFPTAAKTGTVGYPGGGNRDAWTAAYTPTVSVVVWQGFDRPDKEHILPEGMTGGTLPAQLAAAFLQETAFAADGGEFPVPEGMREVLLDASTLGGEEGVMLASERTPKQYLLTETLPETSIPLLKSNRWEAPVQVEAIYVYMDRESGCPTVSFVVPDSFSEYRIIRANGNEETEVGVVRGNAGSYASFVDRQAGNRKDTGYYIISRHIARYELGERMESAPSAYVEYRAPGVLERLIEYRQEQQIPEENALFGM